jgi:cryptochrome
LDPFGKEKEKLELRPVFILDPWFVKNAKVGPNRYESHNFKAFLLWCIVHSSFLNSWRFLQESLEDLDKQLRSLGSRLFVIRGKPMDVFEEIFKVSMLFTLL